MTANSAGVVPLLGFLITGTLLLTGCSRRALEQYTRPGDIVDFKTLHSDNCAACTCAAGTNIETLRSVTRSMPVERCR